jgi:hypothetical protein
MRAAIRKTQTPVVVVARDSRNWKMRERKALTCSLRSRQSRFVKKNCELSEIAFLRICAGSGHVGPRRRPLTKLVF